MEIKKKLKDFDIKISKLASELGVSRPTLDNYIDLFEKGQTISNDNYQKIFEYLFSSECKSSIEFAQKYDYVKRTMLNDAKNSVHDLKLSEREEYLKTQINMNVTNNQVNKNLLEFINLFINNSNNDLVKSIYMYFNYSNGFEELSENEVLFKDKALFSRFCKLFIEYNDDTIEIDEESFKKFADKNHKQFEKKKINVSDDEIIKYIKDNISDSNNIDFEKLREMIASREDN